MIKQQFNDLLNTEMDRKDFLKYSGGVLLAAVGVTGMIRLLLGQGGVNVIQNHAQTAKSAVGYGGSAYGR